MRLWDMPPVDMENFRGSPLFFKDPGFGYGNIMWIGNEFFLVIFDIAIYLAWDLATKSTFVGIFLGYITVKVLNGIRNFFSERNISQKTLIDERFLI